MAEPRRVVVLGASNKPDRYSYIALTKLKESGYEVIPINPALEEIEGIKVTKRLEDVKGPVDTITLYVNADRLEPLVDSIITLNPKRIISNPGTESETMRKTALKKKIEYMEACTLVLLSTGQF
jgi:predicted CoA-binding protein